MRDNEMLPLGERNCWEIMQCKGTESCAARRHPEKPCWQIAQEMEDYRSVFKICQDCIVFMLKNGLIFLSEKEARLIVKQAGGRLGTCGLKAYRQEQQTAPTAPLLRNHGA